MLDLTFIQRINDLLLVAWGRAPQLFLTLIVGYLVIVVVKFVIHRIAAKTTRANQAMKGIVVSVIDVALWIFLFAVILHQIGLTQIAFALSSTVAIAGIAISVGSSTFVQDLVSGVFLAQDPDFKIGDKVKVTEVVGFVEKMDARKVRIRDEEGMLHIFPNSTFDRAAWIVLERKNKGGK